MVWVAQAGTGSAIETLDAADTPPPPASALLEQAMDIHESGDMTRALAAYQQVMGLDRDNVAAMIMASRIHADQGEYEVAEFLLRRSLAIAPTCVAYNTLGHVVLNRRQWDASINAFRSSLVLDPSNTTTWPNILFGLDLHPQASPSLCLAERRRFNRQHCAALTAAAPPHANDPDPERRLRIGYVSADFKQHSAAHGFGPVVLGHHPELVDVHLYDVTQTPPNPDDLVATWFRELPTATWHDVRGYDDATLAATIRADAIDILIDLSGYSAGCRPLMFARKPAPVQMTGFGYATGLGIDAMDYLIADATLIPEQHEAFYHEWIVRLPSFMGYEKAPPWPEIGPPPRTRNGYTTYGYLGRAIKLSPQTLMAWGEILGRSPDARMIFKCGEYKDETLVGQIRGALTALGVNPDHLEFRGGSSRYEHIATYNDLDISLDPFPHNGGVTTIESILMGVPTIGLLGTYVCGRTTASILQTLGFRSAIARTPPEYVSHALKTADAGWTLEDRQALRRRLTGSILMDEDRYASAVEDAYRTVWRTWCDQQHGAGD